MNNIKRIQAKLPALELDAVLVTDEKNQRFASGFPFTDGAVLVSRDRAWLITDSRYIEAARESVDESVAVLLYDRERSCVSLLRNCIKEAGVERLGAEEDKLSHSAFLDYERALSCKLHPTKGLFAELRSSKTPEELSFMRQAQDISEQALKATLPHIKPGVSEREIAAELVYNMLRLGSEGNSFDPIVICGKKTSMPHGVPGDQLIAKGDFVTMDFGCVKGGYCSDMTRTFAVGSADDEMRNVYATVLKAQLAGIAAARAGIPGRDIDAAARALIEKAGFGHCFGHGFGHSLGLDIHEAPSLSPSGDRPVPEGAVCSAEPGIYIPGRFGVRIEDVMILRSGGAELLTRFPKELVILKA